MKFQDLKVQINEKEITLNDSFSFKAYSYLPQNKKAEFIKYVVDNSIDDVNATFSPLRIETYFALAIVKWYSDIELEDLTDAGDIYDILETNDIIDAIISYIPKEEYKFIYDCVIQTAKDISDYAHSAAGLIQAMNSDASDLNTQLNDILEKIKNKEGIEELSAIREIMGKTE